MSLRRRVMGQKEVNDLFVGAEGIVEITADDVANGKVITHGLGVVPFYVEIEPVEFSSFSGQGILAAGSCFVQAGKSIPFTFGGRTTLLSGNRGVGFWGRDGSATPEAYSVSNNDGNYISAFTATTFRWKGGASYPILPGTYKWRAFAFKELGGNP